MKYIDADLLRKEVRRLEKVAHRSALGCADSETRRFHEGKDFAYQYVGAIIASLLQEHPEVDLEKFISDFIDKKDSENQGKWCEEDIIEAMKSSFALGLNARKV